MWALASSAAPLTPTGHRSLLSRNLTRYELLRPQGTHLKFRGSERLQEAYCDGPRSVDVTVLMISALAVPVSARAQYSQIT